MHIQEFSKPIDYDIKFSIVLLTIGPKFDFGTSWFSLRAVSKNIVRSGAAQCAAVICLRVHDVHTYDLQDSVTREDSAIFSELCLHI